MGVPKGPEPSVQGNSVRRLAQAPSGNPSLSQSDAARLLTADDLAQRWQVRPKQVYSLTRQGVLPVVRIGRYCRYRLDAIEAWEQRQEGDA